MSFVVTPTGGPKNWHILFCTPQLR